MPASSRIQALWRHPLSLFLIGLSGFLVGIGILWIGYGRTKGSLDFYHSTGFMVWAATIGVQSAFWAVVVGPLWVDLVALWRRTQSGRTVTLSIAVALVLILVVFPMFSAAAHVMWPLWGHTAKIRALTIIGGLVVGVPALSGIVLVQRHLTSRETEPIQDDDLPAALEARSQILRFLSIAGAVIGLAVLAAGALRKATVPAFVADDAFQQEGILLYGAFFTGLLLLVYVPAHLALKRLGLRIRDNYFPLSKVPSPDSDSFKAWWDKRTTLETLLQLNVTPSQQLQASVFILAPLISALITSFVPKPT